MARAARAPEHELHVLRGIKFMDDRFANPAYGLLLVTRISMVLVGDLSLATFWLATALALYRVLTVGGLAVLAVIVIAMVFLMVTKPTL